MRRALACLVALVATAAANAAPITLDFTSGGGGQTTAVGSPCCTGLNMYTEEGFRVHTDVTNNNHFELFGFNGGTTWSSSPQNTMPWHRGGSNSTDPNLLFIDLNGGAFDLDALTVVVNPNGLTFTSSSGATQSLAAGLTGLVSFTGPGWQNITSVTLLIGPGNPSSIHAVDDVLLDNVPTVNTPEPISLVVFGGLLVGGGLVARKRLTKKVAA